MLLTDGLLLISIFKYLKNCLTLNRKIGSGLLGGET
jgi:hypothetical protein